MQQSFWSGPICFGRVQIYFGQVQIIKFSSEKSDLNLTKMIWTRPKRFALNQNDCYLTKMIWSVQNHFGPIKGQGIKL